MNSQAEFDRYRLHENDFLDQGYQQFVLPLVEIICRKEVPTARGLDFGSGPDSAAGYLLRQKGYKIEKFDPFFHPDPKALEQKYDFLVACEVVEHFNAPAESFEKMRELLNPKGSMYLMTSLRQESSDFKNWYYRRDPTHISFYSSKTFQWIQKRFEFQMLNLQGKNLIELSS